MREFWPGVRHAGVDVEAAPVAAIGPGFLILLGVGHGDDEETARKLWGKIEKLRVFDDESGKTNLNLAAIGGSVLVVSQFTLYANCKKGNRRRRCPRRSSAPLRVLREPGPHERAAGGNRPVWRHDGSELGEPRSLHHLPGHRQPVGAPARLAP